MGRFLQNILLLSNRSFWQFSQKVLKEFCSIQVQILGWFIVKIPLPVTQSPLDLLPAATKVSGSCSWCSWCLAVTHDRGDLSTWNERLRDRCCHLSPGNQSSRASFATDKPARDCQPFGGLQTKQNVFQFKTVHHSGKVVGMKGGKGQGTWIFFTIDMVKFLWLLSGVSSEKIPNFAQGTVKVWGEISL